MLAKGLDDFKAAAREIESVLGSVPIADGKPERSDDDKRAALKRLWDCSTPIKENDPVAAYLFNRVRLLTYPKCLRTAMRVRYEDDQPSYHPAMLAKVTDPTGRPTSVHRTYLTHDGRKADVADARRMMPGSIANGSAVRLMPYDGIIGIAEGIETALAASKLFGVPCWAALNAGMLSEWEPPEGVEEVIVFGDNDAKFAGQAAAYSLARRLSAKGMKTSVEIPLVTGQDFNDVFAAQGVVFREAAE
jgi:putative DNA primase/helicase